ncbi:hypothetical protein V494_06493 [Pseudogymnoascus sp. VKM F-4513 (FW-928)]|nr:hypothetical protein V494_06493 [Pseudogymnoascus sp. VKM F-4513 (FW-928)]
MESIFPRNTGSNAIVRSHARPAVGLGVQENAADIPSLVQRATQAHQYGVWLQSNTASSPGLTPHGVDLHGISTLRRLPIGDIVNAKHTRYASFNDQKTHWAAMLIVMLPTRATCDALIDFFFENLSWVYRVHHAPTFMLDYEAFWGKELETIDIHFLAMLFSLILASGIRVTERYCVEHGIDFNELRENIHIWYSAIRQALSLGDADSNPSIEALQAMITLQHYLYATRKDNVIKLLLVSAVEGAHALGLDSESTSVNMVQREVHHRVWWEICVSDTYHAMSTQNPTLVQSYQSPVPAPLNCSDMDISASTITVHASDEPTEMSMNIARGQIFQVFNRLLMDHGAHLDSFEFVVSLDAELFDVMDQFPWFFKPKFAHRWAELSPEFHFVPWAYQLLNGCICMQRIRMYWPFITTKPDTAWEVIMAAASDALTVYQMIRGMQQRPIKDLQNCGIIYYQLFSVAVTLASLLLVHRPEFHNQVRVIRGRIETVALDLAQLSTEEVSPLASEQSKIIGEILEMYDFPSKVDPRSTNLLISQLRMALGGRSKLLGPDQAGATPRSDTQEPSIHTPDLETDISVLKADIHSASELSERFWASSTIQEIFTNIDLVCLGLEQNSLRSHLGIGVY